MRVLVLHGPNLNLLGSRELEVYGTSTLAEVDEQIRAEAAALGIAVDLHQTSSEGQIIDLLHAGIGSVQGAILNPAAYSHTSRAIADAIRGLPYPVVEAHLSNIHAREPWRRRTVTGEAAIGIVAGFGPLSYVLALQAIHRMASD